MASTHLRRRLREAFEHVRDALVGLVAVLGVEHLPQGGGNEVALVAAAVALPSVCKARRLLAVLI